MRIRNHQTKDTLSAQGPPIRAESAAARSTPSGRRRRQGGQDRERFDEAYRTLFATIFRVAYRISGDSGLAEDMTHEAFMQLLRRERRLPSSTETKYWLLRVVRNLSLNVENRRGREQRANQRALQLAPGHHPSAADEAVASELRSEVQVVLDGLPQEMRTILSLREYADLSYREIATVMHITENNVKVRLYRARQRMAVALKDLAGH